MILFTKQLSILPGILVPSLMLSTIISTSTRLVYALIVTGEKKLYTIYYKYCSFVAIKARTNMLRTLRNIYSEF